MQAVCPRCQLLPQPHQPTAVAVACFMAKELADPSCQCIMLGVLFNLLHPLSSSQSSFLSFSGIRVSLSGNRPLTLFFSGCFQKLPLFTGRVCPRAGTLHLGLAKALLPGGCLPVLADRWAARCHPVLALPAAAPADP